MKQKVVHFPKLAAVLCLCLGLCGGFASAQNRGITVKGNVVDSDGLPVIGAGVTLKGTTTGVAADLDGNFSLNVPDEAAVLEVQALGYVTEEVRVGKQRNLTVVLRDDTQSLEATVVVAYGTQTKATVTGALTAIDSKVLVKAPVADVTNVLAGQMFDIPVKGTHAHSWIMSFPDEYSAFKSYAEIYPDACILLADTYDTLGSGVPNAIRVFKELREAGVTLKNYGIRLDSGDLAYLSKKARAMLDEAGFADAVISASNDLDEVLISSLKAQGAAITSWGVGTNLITAKDNPSFGGVYKLAAVMGEDGAFVPKIKLSENTEKVTNPGDKRILRVYDDAGKVKADLICLAEEVFDEGDELTLFDPQGPGKGSHRGRDPV